MCNPASQIPRSLVCQSSASTSWYSPTKGWIFTHKHNVKFSVLKNMDGPKRAILQPRSLDRWWARALLQLPDIPQGWHSHSAFWKTCWATQHAIWVNTRQPLQGYNMQSEWTPVNHCRATTCNLSEHPSTIAGLQHAIWVNTRQPLQGWTAESRFILSWRKFCMLATLLKPI